MKKYIFKRVLISLATLFVILLVLFILMDLMPGTPFNDEKLTQAQKDLLFAIYPAKRRLWTKNLISGRNKCKNTYPC